MNKHIHAMIIHAYAEGAEIQRLYSDGSWHDIEHPQFLPGNTYRIKPRTVKREGWVNLYKVTRGIKSGPDIYDTEAEARHKAFLAVIATVKVEWKEEE